MTRADSTTSTDDDNGGATIHRSRPKSRFLILANAVAEDSRLSYKALGLLVSLLCKPPDWECRVRAMQRDTDRRDAVRTALHELRRLGYASLDTRRDERGRYQQVYYIYDRPDDNDRPDPIRDDPTGTETPIRLLEQPAATEKPNRLSKPPAATDYPATGNPSPYEEDADQGLNNTQTSATPTLVVVEPAATERTEEQAHVHAELTAWGDTCADADCLLPHVTREWLNRAVAVMKRKGITNTGAWLHQACQQGWQFGPATTRQPVDVEEERRRAAARLAQIEREKREQNPDDYVSGIRECLAKLPPRRRPRSATSRSSPTSPSTPAATGLASSGFGR